MSRSSCAEAALTCRPVPSIAPEWHEGFLKLLPAICRQARHYFRGLDAEALDEAVAEVAANSMIAYCRLVELGKSELAFATPLALYACRQYQAGRRVGLRQNTNDATSECCQRRHHFTIVNKVDWRELVDQRRSTPAEIAAARVDFDCWLGTLEPRDRKLVQLLASGESTSGAARLFRVTAGRISQLRRELAAKWGRFMDSEPAESAAGN